MMLQVDRQLRHHQSSRSRADRAADRRAARRSHRHAAHGEGRSDQLHLRRAAAAPHSGGGNGAGKSQAPGRAQARRGHPARLGHASGARLQRRHAALGQSALRRYRRQRLAAPAPLLRRRAQHRRGRLAHHHGHGADRYRQPHGRRDLRGVQGHRQHGNQPRPPPGGQAHLPGDRHQSLGNAKRRAADAARRTEPRLGAAQGAQPALAGGSDGIAPGTAVEDQVQRGISRLDVQPEPSTSDYAANLSSAISICSVSVARTAPTR